MCKKLAIFPAITVILSFTAPKNALAALPVNTEEKTIFYINTDIKLNGGFAEKEEQKPFQNAEKAAEPDKKSGPEKTAEKPSVAQKRTKKTFSCSEEDLKSEKCRTFQVLTTGYSSTVDQCDADPFTTASGKRVHLGTLACNFLPFGTLVKFPDYFGDRIFIVEDRMAKRFSDRMDVWFETRQEALQFGARKLTAEVVR